jgi:AmmeMemoRadiSam system protein B
MVDDSIPADPVSTDRWQAALVPHAGLSYSGKIAADVLRRIDYPETIVVIGPKHTPLGVEWSVCPHDKWLLPGLEMKSDRQLAEELAAAITGLELDALAHQREHAIEVELPFIHRFAPLSKVVGIAIGGGTLAQCLEFADGLSRVLARRSDRALLVISSDMNHYASDQETRRVDQMAIEAIESLDPENVFRTVRDNDISMCGVLPAVIVMQALRNLGRLKAAVRVAYGTSADVSHETSRVVGYAGMLFQ